MEPMAEMHRSQQTRWRSAIKQTALVLALVILAHQFFMITPLRAVMPDMASSMAPVAELMSAGGPCDGSCPSTIAQVCVPGRVCEAVQAALTHTPLILLVLFALLALTAAATQPPLFALWHERWLWPPARRRALLQVFLI